jgi:hypothetical protein
MDLIRNRTKANATCRHEAVRGWVHRHSVAVHVKGGFMADPPSGAIGVGLRSGLIRPLHTRHRPAMGLASVIVAIALSVSMSGCVPSDDFSHVDAIATNLRMSDAGQIVSQVRYGQSHSISGGPTVETLLSPSEGAQPLLESRLRSLGFSNAGLDAWRRAKPFATVALASGLRELRMKLPGNRRSRCRLEEDL